jgi:hypothetical protein
MAEYVSEVIDDVLTDLNESITSPVHLTRAQALRYVNSCQRDLCANELVLASSQQAVVLANGVRTYDLDEDALTTAWGVYDSEPMAIVTKEMLDAFDRDWLDSDGEPFFLLVDYERPRSVTIYKEPDSTYAGTYVYLQNFQRKLSDLVDDDTATLGSLRSPFQYERELFYDFVMWKALLRRSGIQDVQAAGYHMNNYMSRLNVLRTRKPKKLIVVGSITQPTRSRRGPTLPDDYPMLAYV